MKPTLAEIGDRCNGIFATVGLIALLLPAKSSPLVNRCVLSTSAIRPLKRSTMPLVRGVRGLVRRCSMFKAWHSGPPEQRNFIQLGSQPVLLKSANSRLGTKSEKVMRF
jgi:hypothetical protein